MTTRAELTAIARTRRRGGTIPATDVDWTDRLRLDRDRARQNQSPGLAAITAEVEARCRELGAQALVLTGSTARGRCTPVSDLDYHVIGARPDVADLAEDIDLYSDEPAEFLAKLREGDDFVQWSVRCGCVLFDTGPIEEGARLITRLSLWPDPGRKLWQARRTLEFAEQLVASGDYEAALEQTRGALSLTARWYLLAHDTFPLARDELSSQLPALGFEALAQALSRSIHERPPEATLARALNVARALVDHRTAQNK